MNRLTLKTDLRCEACVAAIRPLLDGEPGIVRWSADVQRPDKPLTVEGEGITADRVHALLQQHGYSVSAVLPSDSPATAAAAADRAVEPKQSYFPLLLILGYILAATAAVEVAADRFDGMRAMNHFMAGFFLVFSFFKLLNLRAFADAYAGYDVVARRCRAYGLAYPFVELALGLAYLAVLVPIVTNLVTLLVMGISTVGVVNSIFARRKIRCACLGSVFNLPMSYVTLTEDLLMVVMSAVMLVVLLGGMHSG